MRQVTGDILPVALGVAISPVPIIAVIPMQGLAGLEEYR